MKTLFQRPDRVLDVVPRFPAHDEANKNSRHSVVFGYGGLCFASCPALPNFKHIAGTKFSAAGIDRLLGTRRPSAIKWSVITIVVNSIQGIFWRAFAHATEKRLETIHPLFAHGDPTPAVVFPVFTVGIRTPRFCGGPRPILTAELILAGISVNKMPWISPIARRDGFGLETSTATRASFAQTRTRYPAGISTITATHPESGVVVSPIRRSLYDGPTPKSLSGAINSRSWHLAFFGVN